MAAGGLPPSLRPASPAHARSGLAERYAQLARVVRVLDTVVCRDAVPVERQVAAAAACPAAPGLGPTGRTGPHRRRQALRSAIVGGGISLSSWPERRGWLV